MGTAEEVEAEAVDFSFPIIITDNQAAASSIDSPPLWHLSPAASPVHSSCNNNNNNKPQQQQEEEDCFLAAKTKDPKGKEEDKMDILWEDFNCSEELSRNICSKGSNKKSIHPSSGVQALRLSKNGNNGALFSSPSSSKPGFLVLVKVFKKLFLLHHHHSSVKNNRPW
ncbi:hypothetical protein OWV82_024438 [Melia azedarach]|uniref:Uncharacterized protein n=1 Tax=Melia azedarach TaxID=155640 RepID=A0ACC1WQC2_MELAZ|nr:hypothetical protein OWV82_024438 [Melia azedarach]